MPGIQLWGHLKRPKLFSTATCCYAGNEAGTREEQGRRAPGCSLRV
jgi:hypothetical protein